MTDHPSLFDDLGPAPIEEILERHEVNWSSYLDGCRTVLYVMAQERPVSADDLHKLIADGTIPEPPEGMHANAFGALFRDDRFRPVGWTRSERDGSHGNLLRTWVAD